MSGAKERLDGAVAEFRAWAAAVHPGAGQYGEWEAEYEGWPVLWQRAGDFLAACHPETWDHSTVQLLLYVLARDNEMEQVKEALVERPNHLLVLAKAGLASAEPDARWQLADGLGSIQADEAVIEAALQAYAVDPDEYVSRRALLALGRRRSPVAVAFAQRAWDNGHEYQRIAALEVMSKLGSQLLPAYLERAIQDGRRFVVEAACRAGAVRSPRPDE